MATDKIKKKSETANKKEDLYSLFNSNNFTVYLTLTSNKKILIPSHGCVKDIKESEITLNDLPSGINPFKL